MHTRTSPALGALSFALLMSTPALATVTEGDDLVFGTGSLTIDSDQNLEFLDVTTTAGQSIGFVTGELSGAGIYSGFRYATSNEVLTLITNSGVSLTFLNNAFGTIAYNMSTQGSINTLFDLVGVTTSQDFGDGPFSLGLHEQVRGVYSDGGQYFGNELNSVENPTFEDRLELYASNPLALSFQDNSYGHWLVREVPAPSSLALFSLLALSPRRRR